MAPAAVDTTLVQPPVQPPVGQPATYRPSSESYPTPVPRSRPVSSGGMSVDDVHPARPRRGVRRARLRLTRIDPWSALKVSLVFAAFLFIVWIVAVIVLFAILSGAGVFSSVNSTLTDVFGTQVNFSGSIIVGGAAVIGALSVVIVTALGTIVAFAYNATAGLLGGLDVTLTESD
jgi:hypothetical protein